MKEKQKKESQKKKIAKMEKKLSFLLKSYGQVYCLSGSMALDRQTMLSTLENEGLVCTENIKKASVLVVGKKKKNKINIKEIYARKHGLEILHENDLDSLCGWGEEREKWQKQIIRK